ncbi:MAG: helix-turn-helix transcriptional regulator [Clostridia bacterium]|nr:helix-turn-helix transcriptional regulator [Clostridia bacterium]
MGYEDFCDKTGITLRRLQRYFRSNALPKVPVFIKFCDVLHCSFDYLAAYTGENRY